MSDDGKRYFIIAVDSPDGNWAVWGAGSSSYGLSRRPNAAAMTENYAKERVPVFHPLRRAFIVDESAVWATLALLNK